jgi:hypothetical protein
MFFISDTIFIPLIFFSFYLKHAVKSKLLQLKSFTHGKPTCASNEKKKNKTAYKSCACNNTTTTPHRERTAKVGRR